MPDTYIVVDIETTGLDAHHDAIIEIAAIAFAGNEIVEEFNTLVHPHMDIPDFISELTGITNEMVADAPSMFSVRASIKKFLGEHTLVGHNVDFDLGFLREERIALNNPRLDTLTLASILAPEAGRFNLESLVRHFNIPSAPEGQTHRALDDAMQTVELFLALQEIAQQIEPDVLEEIVQAGARLGWPETAFFQEALATQSRSAFQQEYQRRRGRLARLYNPPKLKGRPLIPAEEPEPIDRDIVADMLKPGGNFSQAFPAYEYRPQQVQMLEAVVEAFNHGAHNLIEAGTGTGKSVGYLLPSIFWAVENGRRVVISTNTINLQDQLLQKDIPNLQKLLPFSFEAAIRKGRSNYICTRLFQQMRHTGPSNGDEMALYARILRWLPHSETGDMGELSLQTQGERLAWSRLNAENACTAEHCATEGCPLHYTKQKAEQSHILIVNHALLLSDVANNGHILPEFADLVVDEAHHLESAVTSGLSFSVDKRYLETILDEIIKPRAGLVADLQARAQTAYPEEVTALINEFAQQMRQIAVSGKLDLDEFFDVLSYFASDHVRGGSQFAQQIRLVEATRHTPEWGEVERAWERLGYYLKQIGEGFQKLAKALGDVSENFDLEGVEDLMLALASNGRSLNETRDNLQQIIHKPDDSMINWVEVYRDRYSIHSAPLHIGPLVEEHIFNAKETVILTSATMQTAGAGFASDATFDYIKDRLFAHDVSELSVGSPFDYKNQTLLYLVNDIPEPNQPGYQRYLEDAIVEVATVLGGRTMVLFTSYSQLSQTQKGINGRLADQDIITLAQSKGASRQQLLDQFKRPSARAVLLGTRSFWEGVDVPGDALQALVLTKFPFDVPSDPVFAARAETFDNSFFAYSIPEAVLRFRQGFGRLNRRSTDEGVVLVLDKRILTKRYGAKFLEALPECTTIRQPLARIGELTLRWLNRDKSKKL